MEYLTKESLLKVFQRSNKDISDEELDEMMREVELDEEAQIDFEKFTDLMKDIFVPK